MSVITTHGKWILAGEHAVLRGHAALVFPTACKLDLCYQEHSELLITTLDDDTSFVLKNLLCDAWQRLSDTPLYGRFQLQNTIPVGMGMGASAALCVAVAKFCATKIIDLDVMRFAHELEHIFHGRSSGVDIVGVASTVGQYFKLGETAALTQTWQPNWYLSHCGMVGRTSDCVQKVQKLWENDPIRAAQIDTNMAQAVEYAVIALQDNTYNGFVKLCDSINMAAKCFFDWDLVPADQALYLQHLRALGAAAVKTTGAGGGGFVLSLWPQPITASLFAEIGAYSIN